MEKFEILINNALQEGLISFHDLEKLAGKCTSISTTVYQASLFTYHMYKKTVQYQRTGAYSNFAQCPLMPNNGLRSKMKLWLEVWSRMNGALYYGAAHHPLFIRRIFHELAGVVRGPQVQRMYSRLHRLSGRVGTISHHRVGEIFSIYRRRLTLGGGSPRFPTSQYYHSGR